MRQMSNDWDNTRKKSGITRKFKITAAGAAILSGIGLYHLYNALPGKPIAHPGTKPLQEQVIPPGNDHYAANRKLFENHRDRNMRNLAVLLPSAAGEQSASIRILNEVSQEMSRMHGNDVIFANAPKLIDNFLRQPLTADNVVTAACTVTRHINDLIKSMELHGRLPEAISKTGIRLSIDVTNGMKNLKRLVEKAGTGLMSDAAKGMGCYQGGPN